MAEARHVLVEGEGFYAGTTVCLTCDLAFLAEDADTHCARLAPSLSVFEPDPVERDPRESSIVWEKPGGDAA